ncbi:MAG: hypothetical protein WDN01_04275 [Rhizomicrobium sp.]
MSASFPFIVIARECGRPNFLFAERKLGCPDKPGNDEFDGWAATTPAGD